MEVPLLLLSGAAPAAGQGRGAFQDLDQASAARVACKESLDASSIERIAPTLAEAWALAQAGVPGPVHVSLPADTLLARVAPGAALVGTTAPPVEEPDRLREIAARLARAARPAIIVRPSAARGAAGAALAQLAATLGVPPIVTGAPRGLSDLKYAEAFRALPGADVVLVVAPADFAAGFLDAELLRGDVLLVDAGGDVEPACDPTLRCRAAPSLALPALAQLITSSASDPTWRARLAQRDALPEASDDAEGLHPLSVAAAVREVLRHDDTLVLDGGEFCQWARLGLRDAPNLMLWNGKLGAIGGSFPQALGVAAAGAPGRVLVLLGDGAAGYHLSELETAVRENLPFVAIIGNDARWAAEWHQQVNRYGPERTFSTTLLPARYDQAAVGFGADGADAPDADALRDALERGLASGRPTVINAHVRSVQSPAVVL